MTELTEQIIHKKEIQLKVKLEDIIILSESIQNLTNQIKVKIEDIITLSESIQNLNQIYNEIKIYNKTKEETKCLTQKKKPKSLTL